MAYLLIFSFKEAKAQLVLRLTGTSELHVAHIEIVSILL